MRIAGVAIVVLLAAGCGEETGPEMRPGENCLRCHSSGGEAEDHRFTAAGTVFPAPDAGRSEGIEGAIVRLRAADGETIELRTNAAGNFYTRRPLAADPRPEVEYRGQVLRMETNVADGACNGCHTWPPRNGAPGRIHVP